MTLVTVSTTAGTRTLRVLESPSAVRLENSLTLAGQWFTLTAANGSRVSVQAGTVTALREERTS